MSAFPPRGGRPLTGRHVLAMFAGGFAVIIGANLALAFNAMRSFPGLETRSAYVASQHFDSDRAAQDALGWTVHAEIRNGVLRLAVADGAGPVTPRIVAATLGRATTVAEDRTPDFAAVPGGFEAAAPVAPGNWNLRLEMRAPDGTRFRRRIPLVVR